MNISKQMQITSIRIIAKSLVAPTTPTDWQILVVARHAGFVRDLTAITLDDLNDYDLEMLCRWMAEGGKGKGR